MAEEKHEVVIERIGNQSSSLHAMELRRKMLQDLLSAPLDAPNPEYVVITGCHGPFSLLHLTYLTNLLRHLGVNFTFLAKELCCGNSYLKHVKKDEPPQMVEMLEQYSVGSMRQNISKAKELGTNKIITSCAGCTTRYNHFLGDDGSIELIYYPQLLLKYVDSPELNGAINWYEACHKDHCTSKYKIDTDCTRQLIGKIWGLEIREIPNYCCLTEVGLKKLFEKADTGVIVTPTSCCFSNMRAKSNKMKGPRIKALTEVLGEALGVNNIIR